MNISRALRLSMFFLISALPMIGCSASFSNPPSALQPADLAGTWVAHYGDQAVDTVVLNANGTFRQIFQDKKQNYYFTTPQNKWTLEKSPNGGFRIHLYGARYYLEGVEIGEKDGRRDPQNPCIAPSDCSWGLEAQSFYDPFSDEYVKMVDELILDVRTTQNGRLVLHHLWTSSDRGFAIIGGEEEVFSRAEPEP